MYKVALNMRRNHQRPRCYGDPKANTVLYLSGDESWTCPNVGEFKSCIHCDDALNHGGLE